MVTHRTRTTSEHVVRAIGGSSDPHVRLCGAPYGVPTASVTRPAKGEILVGIEVPSVRSDECGLRESLPRSHASPVSVCYAAEQAGGTCARRTDAFFFQRSVPLVATEQMLT